MKKLSVLSILFVAVISAVVWAATSGVDERIKPVGELCMAGDDCAAAATTTAAADGPRSGEEVYGAKCASCHNSGAAGAPRLGDANDWAARSAKGIDTLYANAINGIGQMPAGGMCFGGCSEDEIKAAVDHLLNSSK